MAKEKEELEKENEQLKKRVNKLEQIISQGYNSINDIAYQMRKLAENE